jgi:hypothetical protein
MGLPKKNKGNQDDQGLWVNAKYGGSLLVFTKRIVSK